MSLLNSCLLISSLLTPVALIAQKVPGKNGVIFTDRAYNRKGGDALETETHLLRGGGPYWILLQYPKGPVAKPLFVEASDCYVKILLILPKRIRGFEDFQDASVVAQRNQHIPNKF
jgi:hypothetical protein